MADWDRFYDEEDVFIPDSSAPHAKKIAEIASNYIDMEDSNVLDVGCGTCILSIAFKEMGAHVTGIDLNDRAVQIAKDIVDTAYVCDAFNLPGDDMKYDMVVSGGLLEHFEDDEIVELLEEQKRVSKNYVFTIIPNPEDTIYRAYKKAAMDSGEWIFGKERPVDITRLAPKAGLRVILCEALSIGHTTNLLREIGSIVGESYPELIKIVSEIDDNAGYIKAVLMARGDYYEDGGN